MEMKHATHYNKPEEMETKSILINNKGKRKENSNLHTTMHTRTKKYQKLKRLTLLEMWRNFWGERKEQKI